MPHRERLYKAGFKVIPVTAGSSGWCDLIARMWPVDAVVGENGQRTIERIVYLLRTSGARTTINSLWILGWLGGFDKLAMTRRLMAEVFALDIEAERQAFLYVGDSLNDEPMFGFFENSVGVSTVTRVLGSMSVPPRWITRGPGGTGFNEIAGALLHH